MNHVPGFPDHITQNLQPKKKRHGQLSLKGAQHFHRGALTVCWGHLQNALAKSLRDQMNLRGLRNEILASKISQFIAMSQAFSCPSPMVCRRL